MEDSVMARHEIVVYRDDLDGSEEGVKVVKFGLDGISYEIDLGPANHEKLRSALAPYIAVAAKAGGAGGRRTRAVAGTRRASGAGDQKDLNARIRSWAVSKGEPVKERGRVPEKLREAYFAAGGK
jgi:hypothetical protein